MNKLCIKCGDKKDIEMFYASKINKDGRRNCCKECFNAAVKKYQQTDAGKAVVAKAQRKHEQTEKRQASRARADRKYQKTEKGRVVQRARRKRNQEKRKAVGKVNYAIKSGKLKKPIYCCVDSSDCKGRIEGHHFDYSRPLDVTWLCQKHHTWVHKKLLQKEDCCSSSPAN